MLAGAGVPVLEGESKPATDGFVYLIQWGLNYRGSVAATSWNGE